LKLGDIYDLFIAEGIRTDPRTVGQIQKKLGDNKKEYRKLVPARKKFFDKESLKNPYSDTRILNGDRDIDVRRVLVGIDIEIGELLLADRFSSDGKKIDLVLSHHPEGIALAGLYDVIDLQTDLLSRLGIDYGVAKSFMDKRIEEVERSLHAKNHSQIVDAAKLLDIPFMCCHTPADNHVVNYLQKTINAKKPKTLKKVIDLLLKEPEYKDGMINKAGPRILAGQSSDKPGKVLVDMTGGTEGSRDMFARISQVGVKTLLGMHLSEAHYKRVLSECMNVIIAGHIASDNLGMNLLLDKIEKKTDLEILCCSGFRRYKR